MFTDFEQLKKAKSNKKFIHNLLDLPDLTSETTEGLRVYNTPNGEPYVSMTTVLKMLSEKDIAKWRKRVGEEEADRISDDAREDGEQFHAIMEHYLRNEDHMIQDFDQRQVFMFNTMKKHVNKIDNVRGIEIALWSDHYKIAGRADCIADFEGIPSIIDFKTSRKEKKEKWIESYFLQATGYSLFLEELTGLRYEQLVIIMRNTKLKNQIFIRQRSDFVDRFDEVVTKYFKTHGY